MVLPSSQNHIRKRSPVMEMALQLLSRLVMLSMSLASNIQSHSIIILNIYPWSLISTCC